MNFIVLSWKLEREESHLKADVAISGIVVFLFCLSIHWKLIFKRQQASLPG